MVFYARTEQRIHDFKFPKREDTTVKHILHFNKAINNISILLVFLVIVFITIGATAQTNVEQKSFSQIAVSNYQAAQQNSELSEEEKIKALIDAYFTLRYEGQKLLEAQDFSVLVEDNTLSWVKLEKDRREIELYIASTFGLRYQSYAFTINYNSIEVTNNKAVVQLQQSHQVVYEATTPEISELTNLVHTLTLHSKGGVWVIYKDEYQDEFTKLLTTTPKEKIKQQIDYNYENSRKSIVTTTETLALTRQAFSLLSLPSYSYNRSAANTFSYNNALILQAPIPTAIKNAYQTIYGVPYPSNWPTTYKNEDNNGGDCTNFVSQSIFEGSSYTNGDASYFNPTPDDYNWYYKFSQYPQGSTTWIRVGWLYDYLLNTDTSKRGPYGIAIGSSSFCTSINPGDPIFMKSGSDWAHAVIVYSKSSPCTSPSNIRVNSHNSYKRNEPLPTWSGFSWYGVYIQGYRK